eukprot:TRINITY_DN114945_c0_g1_i1.p2 TRINITY_DN114945_c0_g1~~TRINITY_DN114945_c0_g1_i1.p2  ORF type:complete len:148 (-),score=25.38 TRINITY_DN114945_c0_g1_i1:16-408(-)
MGMQSISTGDVDSTSLDTFASGHPELNWSSLNVLKIDAEMAEAEVIAGAAALLTAAPRSKRRPLVVFEYVPSTLTSLGLDPVAPLQVLYDLGFVVMHKQQEILPAHVADFAASFGGGNLHAWPRSSEHLV